MKKRRHGMLSEAAAAHHEAGHAVACYFHGVKVTHASIVPNEYSLGRVRYEKMFRNLQPDIEMSGRARLQIERAIIISLAGLSAQRRYNNKSWRSYHGERDFRYAVDLALQVAGDGASASAYLKWLQICADELVVCRWPEVARVARALLEHKTMRGGEISDVIDGDLASTRHELTERMNKAKAAKIERQQKLTNLLAPVLTPAFTEIERCVGFKMPKQAFRSRLMSAVLRECMTFAERQSFAESNKTSRHGDQVSENLSSPTSHHRG